MSVYEGRRFLIKFELNTLCLWTYQDNGWARFEGDSDAAIEAVFKEQIALFNDSVDEGFYEKDFFIKLFRWYEDCSKKFASEKNWAPCQDGNLDEKGFELAKHLKCIVDQGESVYYDSGGRLGQSEVDVKYRRPRSGNHVGWERNALSETLEIDLDNLFAVWTCSILLVLRDQKGHGVGTAFLKERVQRHRSLRSSHEDAPKLNLVSVTKPMLISRLDLLVKNSVVVSSDVGDGRVYKLADNNDHVFELVNSVVDLAETLGVHIRDRSTQEIRPVWLEAFLRVFIRPRLASLLLQIEHKGSAQLKELDPIASRSTIKRLLPVMERFKLVKVGREPGKKPVFYSLGENADSVIDFYRGVEGWRSSKKSSKSEVC